MSYVPQVTSEGNCHVFDHRIVEALAPGRALVDISGVVANLRVLANLEGYNDWC